MKMEDPIIWGKKEMSKRRLEFDYIWDEIVLPTIKYCLASVNNEDRIKMKIRCKNLDVYKITLRDMFYRKRDWLKRNYLPDQGNSARLDFHKLSAVLCRCIIGTKAFTFDRDKAEELFAQKKQKTPCYRDEILIWEIDHIYINYKLAFYASVGMVYLYLISWAKKEIQGAKDEDEKNRYREFLNGLDREKFLVQYNPSSSHNDFASSMIIALMKNDLLMRDFDYLMYAASMYQWQEYTKRVLFAKEEQVPFMDPIRYFIHANDLTHASSTSSQIAKATISARRARKKPLKATKAKRRK